MGNAKEDEALTPERLAEIEEREAKATKGPWERADEDGPFFEGRYAILCPHEIPSESLSGKRILLTLNGAWDTEADNAFIAHAREDVPTLTAEIRRLWARVEELATLVVRQSEYIGGDWEGLR